MKVKKEYIILPLIIIALVLYLVLHKENRTHYTLPEPDAVTAKQVNKIEIQKGDQTIVLNKKDDAWSIGEQAFPADAAKIDAMLDVIADFKISALVSESKKYARYELDDPRKIVIRAWEGGALKREFDMGKSASTYQHTFVKLPQDPNVYHARGNFRSNFDQTVEDLRDKVVMAFKQDEITAVTVKQDDAVIELKQKEIEETPASSDKEPEAEADKDKKAEPPTPKKKVWESADEREVAPKEIKSLLSTLSNYKCESYIDGKTKDDFTNPLTVLTLKDKKAHTLTLYAKLDKEAEKTPAVSSDNAYPFFLSDAKVENLKKKIDALIKKAPAEEAQKPEKAAEAPGDEKESIVAPDTDAPGEGVPTPASGEAADDPQSAVDATSDEKGEAGDAAVDTDAPGEGVPTPASNEAADTPQPLESGSNSEEVNTSDENTSSVESPGEKQSVESAENQAGSGDAAETTESGDDVKPVMDDSNSE